MMRWSRRIQLSLVALVLGSCPVQAQQYTIVDLGPAQVQAIADTTTLIVGTQSRQVARLSNPPALLGSLPSVENIAIALGASQVGVVGNSSAGGIGGRHAVLWTETAGLQDLLPGDTFFSTAFDINDSRTIVGVRSNVAGTFSPGAFQPLPQLDSGQSVAWGINTPGDITGQAGPGAALWPAAGGVISLHPLGATASEGQSINDSQEVCGWADGLEAGLRGLLWFGVESYRVLQPLQGYTHSRCTGVNNAMETVGTSFQSANEAVAGQSVATRWNVTTGQPEDLNGLTGNAAWQLASALDMNNLGTIVGTGLLNGAFHSWALVPTPPVQNPQPEPPAPAVQNQQDLNGDGVADIPFHNRQTGQVAAWFLHKGTFLAGQWLPPVTDMAWHLVGIGDLDGDGKAEWAWYHESGVAVLWFMHGVTVASTQIYTVGADWQLVAIGDVDADGTADLVWWSTSTGRIHVWFFQGGKISHNWDIANMTNREWKIIDVADLEGQGSTGLVWWHEGLRIAAYWPLPGGRPDLHHARVLVSGLGPSWRLVGAIDTDGDGQPDYVWRHVDTGALYTWKLQVGVLQSTTYVEQADVTWESH